MPTTTQKRAYIKDYKKFTGFTLAEVLITLGIIGVVAALTIPALIQNNKNQQIISKLQKAYATISQAIKLSEIDNGAVSTWTYGDGTAARSESFMDTYLVPYLRVAKNCQDTLSSGCWGNVSGAAYYHYYLNTGTDTLQTAVALTDGTYIGLNAISGAAFIFIDINGPKEPNRLGRDIFELMITPTAVSNFRLNEQNPGLYFYGAGLSRDSLKSSSALGCNTSEAGRYCGAMIQLDGWKIADDYP